MPLSLNRFNTLCKILSCLISLLAKSSISSAMFKLPSMSHSTSRNACCNSSAAELTPNIRRLNLFILILD